MSFKKNKYVKLSKVLNEQASLLLFDYFKNAAERFQIVREKTPKSYVQEQHGFLDRSQTRGLDYPPEERGIEIYSRYGDMLFDTLLPFCKPLVEEVTELQLVPTYSYCRLYKTGSELLPHKDRSSCEISASLNLGYVGDQWPLFIGGVPIYMEPGDMTVYRGCDVRHWREKFTGEINAQVFLHYNDINGPNGEKNLYDKRIYLGYPPNPETLEPTTDALHKPKN